MNRRYLRVSNAALTRTQEYQVLNRIVHQLERNKLLEEQNTRSANEESRLLSNNCPTVDVNELLRKLVASGLIGPKKDAPAPPTPEVIDPFSKVALKQRNDGLIAALHSGLQCSNCGTRFARNSSKEYNQHLDQHFRQNHRKRLNSNVAQRRNWYYSIADWSAYEEIEDLDNKETNYFAQQQKAKSAKPGDNIKIPSAPADPKSTDEQCNVCYEKFDLFFNEEEEEWHLKNAIKIDGKPYHPVCFEDHFGESKEDDGMKGSREPFQERENEVITINDDDE